MSQTKLAELEERLAKARGHWRDQLRENRELEAENSRLYAAALAHKRAAVRSFVFGVVLGIGLGAAIACFVLRGV